MTTMRRAPEVDTEDNLDKNSSQDTDLVCTLHLSVDQPCQLLGVGVCGALEPFTAELGLYEVPYNTLLHRCLHTYLLYCCVEQCETESNGQLVFTCSSCRVSAMLSILHLHACLFLCLSRLVLS